jgi:hypothetical protein
MTTIKLLVLLIIYEKGYLQLSSIYPQCTIEEAIIYLRGIEYIDNTEKPSITPKGRSFIEMILNTPEPVLIWTDPRSKL